MPTPPPPHWPSLRGRLLRVVLGWGSLWMVLMALALALVVQQEVDDLADATLQESAEWLSEVSTLAPQALQRADGGQPPPPHTEKLIWQWVDAQGRVQGRSHQAPREALRPPGLTGVTQAGVTWRVYGVSLPNQRGEVLVAERLADRWLTRLEAAWVVVVLTVVMGVGLGVWLRRRIDRELDGLRAFGQAVVAYDPMDTPDALNHPVWRELLPIRDAVWTLGYRLAGRVARERAFSAQAAHALRTPLAGLDAQLAVALRESPDSVRPRLARAREASARLGRVVTSVLSLFRRRDQLTWATHDLGDLLARTGVPGLRLVTTGPTPVDGDADWLVVAFINLLDNVVRHGGRTVVAEVQTDTQFQRVTLTDDGPGIEPDRLQALNRALASRDYEGNMGLGLMLADWVARAHGGAIQLQNAAGGTRVEMLLRHPGWSVN